MYRVAPACAQVPDLTFEKIAGCLLKRQMLSLHLHIFPTGLKDRLKLMGIERKSSNELRPVARLKCFLFQPGLKYEFIQRLYMINNKYTYLYLYFHTTYLL